MNYLHIIKEIEPYVQYRMNEPSTNVGHFMRMLRQKHPNEYAKKLSQWIEYVAGPHWREIIPLELHIILDGWILVVTEEYRLN